MKNKFTKIVVSLLAVFSITACGNTTTTTSVNGGVSSNSSVTTSVTQGEWTGKTNEDFQKAKTTYLEQYEENGETKYREKALNMQTLFTNQNSPHLDPLEESHVMVVPFGFEDATCEVEQTQENIERIRHTFFGTKEEVAEKGGWTSVADYYNTSSYGKSTFKGQVLPNWLVYPGTPTQFENYAGGTDYLGLKAAEYSRDWYLREYAKENHGLLGADAKPLSWFDQNGDGFIDLLWVVYSRRTGTTGNWWAYVTYTNNMSNENAPTVKTLGFASIDWMKEGSNGYDAHTFIHETGHTYGLDDYYDYTASWSPIGKVDMMDNNIGDHNAFSKFSLGWLSPLVVDDNAQITLYPTTTTGDCFIIPSPNYNGTAFDEYMMVEFVAPVGLNEQDYMNSYKGVNGFKEPGIRIYHVDARVYARGKHDTPLTTNPETGVDMRVCNTKGGRTGLQYDADYFEREDGSRHYFTLLSLMESTVNNDSNWTTTSTYNATMSTLYKENATFALSGKRHESRAKAFMPSGSNLWNKAKSIKSWTGMGSTLAQVQEIDQTCTMDYSVKVIDISEDAEHGYKATVQITKNA